MIRARTIVATVSAVVAVFAMSAAVSAQSAPALSVSDTEVAEGTTEITIASASLPDGGYIVIHEGDASSFGDAIGSSDLLEPGDQTDVTITLDRALTDGEYVWAMLHTEDNDNGVYDDAATDKPIIDADAGNGDVNDVVTFPIQITVSAAADSTSGSDTPAPGSAGNAGLSASDNNVAWWIAGAAVIAAAGGLFFARRATGRRA